MFAVRLTHESGSKDRRQSRASTRAPRRRPTSYHPRSTTSATTAIAPSTSETLPRPFAASAPTPSRAGTAGRGTPTCSATTRIGRMTTLVPLQQLETVGRAHDRDVSARSLLREIRRATHLGVDPARERPHELDEIGLLLGGEPERLHVRREPRVLHAAPIVVREHVGQRV